MYQDKDETNQNYEENVDKQQENGDEQRKNEEKQQENGDNNHANGVKTQENANEEAPDTSKDDKDKSSDEEDEEMRAINVRLYLHKIALVRCIESDDCKGVQKFLDKYGEINEDLDRQGNKVLHIAIRAKSWNCFDWFLERKDLNINAPNNLKVTPLVYGLQMDAPTSKLVKLLGKGCDINTSDHTSVTPLHVACQKRNFPITQMLLEMDADVNAKDCMGYVPLHLCLDETASPGALKYLENK